MNSPGLLPHPLRLVLLLIATLASAGSQPGNTSYHATTPAGSDVVQLRPSGAVVTVLGLVECAELEGAQQMKQGLDAKVIMADGAAMQRFPRHFSFRVTASLRKTLLEHPNSVIETREDPEKLLLGLRFKLKAYDGLRVRLIDPDKTALIGVPADIPYDERIYRVTFNVGDQPPTERFVLEVLAPGGERLTRLHFSLL